MPAGAEALGSGSRTTAMRAGSTKREKSARAIATEGWWQPPTTQRLFWPSGGSDRLDAQPAMWQLPGTQQQGAWAGCDAAACGDGTSARDETSGDTSPSIRLKLTIHAARRRLKHSFRFPRDTPMGALYPERDRRCPHGHHDQGPEYSQAPGGVTRDPANRARTEVFRV